MCIRDSVSAGEHLGGWLYRVATNLGFNALRSARRRSHYEAISYENSEGTASVSRSAGVMDPAQAAELADERAHVQAGLRQMQPRDEQVLVLRHSGLSYKQIAATLKLATGSVGALLARWRCVRVSGAGWHAASVVRRRERDGEVLLRVGFDRRDFPPVAPRDA